MMKFKFDANQEFQLKAVSSIVDIFEGQGKNGRDNFRLQADGIYPNRLDLSPAEIFNNVETVQKRNGISQDVVREMDFSVEMETGTGKTYVYLRAILELNRRYNFNKFIILVPSVAIREGVLKTLAITRDHFRELYDNQPYRFYEYVSRNLSQVKNFAQSANLEIMVMTVGSFNKDENILYDYRDQMQGEQPIAYIQKTNPVLILDEPQNMEGEATQEKLKNFNALFRLRFSATHKNLYNLMYQLAPYNAYQMGLVKKIEVYSVADEDESESAAAFVNLLAVTSSRAKLKAKVEVLAKDRQGNIGKKIVSLNQNDDLAKKTNNAVYAGYIVDEMNADAPDFGSVGSVRFKNGVELKRDTEPGRDRKDLMREQIKVTIEQHLKKRRELKKKGIKPLSLFFIDRVDNYIREDGFISKTFDELFNALKSGDKELEKFQPAEVRKGYFAERNGDYLEREKAIAENKEAYDLIMKDKERLLSFDEKTEFIFTHSALKEGWDNPNVFNICTLNATVSTMKKRQEIGRGMRLCVNQDGERVFDRNINLLSVIANENYSDYIARLQTEFIEEGIHKAPPMPANARAKKIIKLRKGFEKDPNFTAIWNKISKKTRYFVAVNAARLTSESVKAINELAIERRQINVTRVAIDIGRETIGSRIIGSGTEEKSSEKVLIDCVNFIKDETNLTRRTVVDILRAVNPKSLFNNPDRFMFEAAKIIKAVLIRNYIEQITYELDGDKFNLAQFEQMVGHKTSVQEISNRHKSIYDAVVFSSDVEKNFAVELDKDERIKLFIKLPGWFTVNTPLGGYVPDWAIVTAKIDVAGKESKEKVYFVIETKGTTDEAGRRVFENQKIECAMRHFEVVDVKYKAVADYSDFAREL